MAKRTASAHQKLFNLDIEALLISDLSPERQNDSENSSTSESCKVEKKFRTKDNKALPAKKIKPKLEEIKNVEKEENEGNEEVYDVSKFFENVGNNFNKSLQVKKSKLGHFTDEVISIYQTRITELMKTQEAEIEELKEHTMNNIEAELNKYQEEFKNLMQQENKLRKILEQQLKVLQKAVDLHSGWSDNFRKFHRDFIQAFEELKSKHRNETLDLRKTLAADVSDLQNKFLVDSKKEEMQSMKKYLSSVYF